MAAIHAGAFGMSGGSSTSQTLPSTSEESRTQAPVQAEAHGQSQFFTLPQLLMQDLEEDLAECIVAWRESGNANVGLDYPRVQVPRTPQIWERQSQAHSDVGSVVLQQQSLGPVLTVNVGGQMFRTTAGTLRKAPFFDSMLRHTEEGHLGNTVDGDGNIFVDRSGDLFGYVLEYLRSGHWLLGERSGDLEFVEVLREEGEFYGLGGQDGRLPLPRISEYVTVWQFRDDTALYVDCLEQTVREDPDHQGLFRLCKYSGGLPLDQQTCTKRFKATSHSIQAVIAYFAMRGFSLQHVLESLMITHTTSADGQSRSGIGTQYMLSRSTSFPQTGGERVSATPPSTQRGS